MCICTHTFSFENLILLCNEIFLSIVVYLRIWNVALCAVQWDPIVYLLLLLLSRFSRV